MHDIQTILIRLILVPVYVADIRVDLHVRRKLGRQLLSYDLVE